MGEWIRSWLNVTTRPGEPAFEEERAKPQANLTTAAIWIGLLALVSGLISLMSGAIAARQIQAMGGLQGILGQLNLPPEVMAQVDQLPAGLVPGIGRPALGIGALIGGIVWSIVFYFFFVGILQLVAKILGGTGNFSKYSYLIAAFWVPIQIVAGLLGLVPLVGICLSFVLWIYQLVLAYYATRVEHKLTPGRSIIVVLAPLLIVLFIFCCFGLAVGGLVGGILSQQ